MISAALPVASERPGRDPRSPRAWPVSGDPAPWTTRALSWWAGLMGVGFIAVSVGWYVASGDKYYERQVPPVDLALIGLVVACAANLWILLVVRRAVGLRRRALVGEAAATSVHGRAVALVGGPASTTLIASPGLKHYHRSDCPMARSKHWPPAARQDHERHGRQACRVCQP